MAGEYTAGTRAPHVTRRALHVGAIGVSIDDPCGVRDHAALLADALAGEDLACSLDWLDRSAGPIGAERAEVGAWAGTIDRTLARERADAVLLHYSVFAFAHRGIPVFARPVLNAIRRSRLPLVTFMHEYAYPWHLGGVRGKVWAATQRVALREVLSASTALVVSADDRAAWLRARAWLPSRPISVAPVFSNLPSAREPAPPQRSAGSLGLFGYGHEGVDFATVLDALRIVRERIGDVELTLLGAPGQPSPAAARWQREAAARGLDGAIGFSGRLGAQQLAERLASCDVLLFAERGGATSRKTTLAASLSSGRPVVALDGSNGWSELARTGAAVIVEPRAPALASAVTALLDDRAARERQGELGRSFAARAMSVQNSAAVVGAALRSAIGGASA